MQSPSLSGPVLTPAGHPGAGVGAGSGVGDISPTYRSALVSPVLKPVRTFISALSSNTCKTAELFLLGSASRTRAAAPETCGQAIEVPLKVLVLVSDEIPADKMLLPGAQMLVHAPKFENPDLLSRESVDPTVIADGTNAGEKLQASRLELPPATITVTPALVAASTASFIALWVPLPPKLMLAREGRMSLVAIQSSAP